MCRAHAPVWPAPGLASVCAPERRPDISTPDKLKQTLLKNPSPIPRMAQARFSSRDDRPPRHRRRAQALLIADTREATSRSRGGGARPTWSSRSSAKYCRFTASICGALPGDLQGLQVLTARRRARRPRMRRPLRPRSSFSRDHPSRRFSGPGAWNPRRQTTACVLYRGRKTVRMASRPGVARS